MIMIKKRKLIILSLVFFVLFLVFVQYFMSVLIKSESEVKKFVESTYEEKILEELSKLAQVYHTKNVAADNHSDLFLKSIATRDQLKNVLPLWKEVNAAVTSTNLFQYNGTHLGTVIHALKTAKIIKVDLDLRGTQLKFLLNLEGNQSVVFKPKWYEKERVIEGPVYAGKDRYGSEILAFYLSGILNRPVVPISTERVINVRKEILPVASKAFLDTSFNRRNSTCVYGTCYYCKREDPICDVNGYLTGAVIFNIGAELKTYRSPWQRTYKQSKKAVWEVRSDYCRMLTGKLSKQRLYDLVDTAIFDFLIQNGDRHHYETINESVVWIDNGKGLGNPNIQHIDILAPLYQCCIIRNSTWIKLQSLSGGLLKEKLLKVKEVSNIVSEQHLEAIEKRLLIVYATVEFCRNRNKIKHNLFYFAFYITHNQRSINLEVITFFFYLFHNIKINSHGWIITHGIHFH